jgi:hypothetical protein
VEWEECIYFVNRLDRDEIIPVFKKNRQGAFSE